MMEGVIIIMKKWITKKKIVLLVSLVLVMVSVFLIASVGSTSINILGFDDFCWDGICYKNPSADIAMSFGGESVTIDNHQEYKFNARPTVGIGLDPIATVARIDSRAFGLSSRVFRGGDAGTFSCGELLYRALISNSCSLFVHVPPEPTEDDRAVVIKAIKLVQECVNKQ
ncbi:hypothetical protein ES708_09140 [subsurface metagenome]